MTLPPDRPSETPTQPGAEPAAESGWARLRRRLGEEPALIAATNAINYRRLHIMASVAVLIHLTHILLFVFTVEAATPQEVLWRQGIIAAHSVLLVIMGLFAYGSRSGIGEARKIARARWLPYVAVIVTLAAGAAIVAIDQLVTSNISPFLIVCTIIAVVNLLPPSRAVLFYSLGYVMFHVGLGITQHTPAILVSNHVNGITSIAIGIALSIILWNTNRRAFFQGLRLEAQQRELEEKNRELHLLALYDPLTGLLNRRSFEEIAQREVAAMQRHGHALSVIITDIDLFKQINDSYGHPVGDQVLCAFSKLLRERLRATDVISRWGGEEFVILLPHTSLSQAVQLAEELRAVIESTHFEVADGPIRFTSSFGVAEMNPQDGTFSHAYRDADSALYTAKGHGRNRVEAAQRAEGGMKRQEIVDPSNTTA